MTGSGGQGSTLLAVDRFLALFGGFESALVVVGDGGAVVATNDVFCEVVGLSHDEVLGARPPYPWWPEEQWAWFHAQLGRELEHALRRGKFSGVFRKPDGTRMEVVGNTSLVLDDRGARLAMTIRDAEALRGAVGALVDEAMAAFSKQPELELQLRRLFDSNIIGIISGQNDRILTANDAFLAMIGYSRADLEAGGIDWPNLTPPEWRDRDAEAGTSMLRTGASGPIEKQYIRRDGTRVWVRIAGAVVQWEPFRWVSFVEDVTGRHDAEAGREAAERERTRLLAELADANARLKVANQRLEQTAYVDPLTGLPNRNVFEVNLDHALARARRSGSRVGVALIDLDGCKVVSDTLGHTACDSVLRHFGTALAAVIRQGDTVARWGGDEFVVVTELLDHPTGSVAVGQRIVDAARRACRIEGRDVAPCASVGIAVCDGTADASTVVRTAERLVHDAKAAGGDRYLIGEC